MITEQRVSEIERRLDAIEAKLNTKVNAEVRVAGGPDGDLIRKMVRECVASSLHEYQTRRG